jgi:multidrug transporter EmrE-like cation transporter
VTWFLALKGIPLSIAYPMQALGYVLVTVLAYLLFHEAVGIAQVAGLAFIVVGVTVLALGSGK